MGDVTRQARILDQLHASFRTVFRKTKTTSSLLCCTIPPSFRHSPHPCVSMDKIRTHTVFLLLLSYNGSHHETLMITNTSSYVTRTAVLYTSTARQNLLTTAASSTTRAMDVFHQPGAGPPRICCFCLLKKYISGHIRYNTRFSSRHRKAEGD